MGAIGKVELAPDPARYGYRFLGESTGTLVIAHALVVARQIRECGGYVRRVACAALDLKALVKVAPGQLQVALLADYHAQVVEVTGHQAFSAQLACDLQTLRDATDGLLVIALQV